jgi:3D-(3,5/4)-trihydroxycyclohexane-1,2-dione acylhydrolase (decyclizing)
MLGDAHAVIRDHRLQHAVRAARTGPAGDRRVHLAGGRTFGHGSTKNGEAAMRTRRLTTAQALITFLKNQYFERDGHTNRFFSGLWGIFGHGNLAGIGQAIQENPDFPYHLCRNEQGGVHIAVAYAKARNRKATFACTTSIGPGATNMVTGAAVATVNRIPVLLLPGDIFARRNVAPVLQQLESEWTQDVSVNDSFRAVSRYWDRIYRPDQLICSLPEAMRVLTSPAQTGAVTLCLPQDVQAEADDFPEEMFEPRVWRVGRPEPERELVARAAQWIREASRPLIIAGGGVLYSEASEALAQFVSTTGIPIGETQAGKGSLPFDHPQNLGAIGVSGTPGANIASRQADVVIAIGTRLSDFTTASKTAFQHPDVRFININVAEIDAYKHAALPLMGDARAALERLGEALQGYQVPAEYAREIAQARTFWDQEVDRIYALRHGPPLSQGEVIGAVNQASRPEDTVVCAAGSLPGDLHKLWRTRRPNGYHLEYGYSCMGYEVAAGVGVKMADPSREVYVMVGDASFLMMSSELVTAVAEGVKINVIIVDNHGFASIASLSRWAGGGDFGTNARYRNPETKQLDGGHLPIDFVKLAEGMGARAVRATGYDDLAKALAEMRTHDSPTVVVVETDKNKGVGSYESWWDVPMSEVSGIESIRAARERYDEAIQRERHYEVAAPRKAVVND